ncbi:hypothetical protein [Streptomyces sp. F63]|uniref:hypothetical protein n=1 Tax=Streptomyces sp. F63 TaxID=2824887 RepID=UPI0027DBD225|nr:hypothetical protein [Streptomyces sp. F63]
MSDAWVWEYDPDAEHVVGGLPAHVVTEVERLARELAVLGRDAGEVGEGGARGHSTSWVRGCSGFCPCRVGR